MYETTFYLILLDRKFLAKDIFGKKAQTELKIWKQQEASDFACRDLDVQKVW